MTNINLSKSRYCIGVQCKKMLWMDQYKPEEKMEVDKESVFKTGKEVGQYAKGIFGEYIDIEFDFEKSKMINATKEALKNKPNNITEASFEYKGGFCSVDILKNDEDGVEIYEVKSSTYIKDIYYDDVAFQFYILNNLGYKIKRACIVYLNKEYIKNGEIDIHKLFKIEDITDLVKSKQEEVEEEINQINEYLKEHNKENEPTDDLGINCLRPYTCEYWEYCTRKLPKPNVFNLGSRMYLTKKFEKYYEGKITFEDLQNEDLGPKVLEQIDFEINNKPPRYEKEEIKKILETLKYPLYFIDFETFQLAIPEFDGTKPYQQLPFQYSLHIVYKNGEIQHKEFLAEIDDKNLLRNFTESMIKDIPEDGSVIVYNKAFEHTVINKLAGMFPDLENELNRINNNMVDFMIPFRERNIYVKEMGGSASIKKVLPALYPDDPKLDYSNLNNVHNGIEASETFLSLKEKTKEEQEELRKSLLKYCKLDTYAMVKIWEKFNEIVGEE